MMTLSMNEYPMTIMMGTAIKMIMTMIVGERYP